MTVTPRTHGYCGEATLRLTRGQQQSRNYLYHLRPPLMSGSVLHPLTTLRFIAPDIYQREILKYYDHRSRPQLLLRRIPKLDCHWNDVIHCAPIHPHQLYAALSHRGLTVKPHLQFYQIPLSSIEHLSAVIYTPSAADSSVILPYEDLAWFAPETYNELERVPTATLAWYDRLARERRVYGHFVGIPHVLVRGSIDVSQTRLIAWNEPPAGY